MRVKCKTPQIRFKGFSEEWEEKKLLDNIEKVIDFRGRTPKKLGLDWSEKGYLALSALNVKNGYIDFNVEANYGDQDLYNKWMIGNELHKNQVLFTTEAPMGNVAQIPDDNKYILSQRTIAFDVKSELIIEDFLAVLLRTPLVYNKLLSLSSGGTAKGVSQRSLSSVDVFITKEISEQTKIGNYFQNLDKLIEQKEQKYQKLRQFKTAMLSKMFPQNGAATPEIRFKGFSGEWEEKRLGDESIDIVAGGDIKRDQIVSFGKYPVLANALTNDGIVGYYLNNFRIKAPAITVTGRGDVGHAKARTVNFTPVVRLLAIQTKHDINFLEKAINNHPVRVESTGVPQLTVPQLSNYQIYFPHLDEQTKIGNYFQKLDILIDLHAQELDKLRHIKKASLEKMFV